MINYNGELASDAANLFNHTNRGFRFGDALFEEVRIIHQQPLFLEAHYFRLMASMRMLRMEIPMNFTLEYFKEQLTKIIVANNWETTSVLARISIFRTGGVMIDEVGDQVAFLIDGTALESPFYTLSSARYEVELYKDFFINTGLISTLDVANQPLPILASIYAEENGYEDCLLLNAAKSVVGTIYGNIFLVNGNSIKTAPLLDGCKNQIMRKVVMDIVKDWEGFELNEASISPFELQKADELFVVNVKSGILPITKYRKKEYTREVARNLLGKLNAQSRFAN
ncbi:MAG: aminotransferase class IV [Bacteroidota bacterium]